jgi:hypothetical protein
VNPTIKYSGLSPSNPQFVTAAENIPGKRHSDQNRFFIGSPSPDYSSKGLSKASGIC